MPLLGISKASRVTFGNTARKGGVSGTVEFPSKKQKAGSCLPAWLVHLGLA